jgi:hypothetical protein
MTEEALIDAVFDVALAGNIDAVRMRTLWVVGVTLLADVLLRSDGFNRERLLRGLVQELRGALVDIPEIMRTGGPKSVATLPPEGTNGRHS